MGIFMLNLVEKNSSEFVITNVCTRKLPVVTMNMLIMTKTI